MDKKIKDNKIEREYIIPLRKRFNIVPRYQKTNKAVKTVKEFLARHMQVRDRDLDKIKLDIYVNEFLWSRGIKNPPSKIKVKATKEGEIVRVELVDIPKNLKFRKLREEKAENAAKEVANKRKAEKVKEEDKTESEEGKQEVSHSSVKAEQEKVDENKAEASKKEVEEEKKEAVIEAGQKIEKMDAKIEKHTTDVKSPKQEKNLRKGYNQSSRGH